MSNRKEKILIMVSLVILIGVMAYVTASKWGQVSNSFFNYSFMDVINILVTCIFGFFLTILLVGKESSHAKKVEIIQLGLDSIIGIYRKIISFFDILKGRSLNESEKRFLIKIFKIASIEINNLDDYLKTCNIQNKALMDDTKQLKDFHFTFKELLTDKPFSNQYILSENDITDSIQKYYLGKNLLHKIKLHLYK